MANYSRQILNAQKAIKRKGQLVTWQSLENGAVNDVDKPWNTGKQKPTDHQVYILFLQDTKESRQSLRYTTGTVVPTGSEIGLMAAQDFEPTVKSAIVRDGKKIGVKSISVLKPGGEPILYTLELST